MNKLKSIWKSLEPEAQDMLSLMSIGFFMFLTWLVIFTGPTS